MSTLFYISYIVGLLFGISINAYALMDRKITRTLLALMAMSFAAFTVSAVLQAIYGGSLVVMNHFTVLSFMGFPTGILAGTGLVLFSSVILSALSKLKAFR
jgi:hypothetical protein